MYIWWIFVNSIWITGLQTCDGKALIFRLVHYNRARVSFLRLVQGWKSFCFGFFAGTRQTFRRYFVRVWGRAHYSEPMAQKSFVWCWMNTWSAFTPGQQSLHSNCSWKTTANALGRHGSAVFQCFKTKCDPILCTFDMKKYYAIKLSLRFFVKHLFIWNLGDFNFLHVRHF